ncbi:MAG TPA: alpha/beta hydrolase [Anaerolineales bacterium]|nr:alpha/beta hydrolase [Anaerolineales bacterium]
MNVNKGYANTPFGQVHYRATPKGDTTPLVLLHQTASSSAMFEGILQRLGTRCWLFAADTPGYGESFDPEPSPSIAFYAEVLHATLQAVGISTCFVFGHHTGAAIAVELAASYPGMVRKMILSGPPLLSETQKTQLAAGLRPLHLSEQGDHLLPVWQRLRGRAPHAPLELTHRETLLTLRADRYHETYQAAFDYDFAGRLAGLNLPILVMAGANDTLRASLEPTFALLQQGEMRVIPDAGTYLCDLQPDLIADILQSYFTE